MMGCGGRSRAGASFRALPECLAVIPARSGSRRVPGKNVRPLCGRPALAYTIDAGLESDLFAQVVVSTDSEEIASLARSLGAEAPFLRAGSLADDHTPVSAVTVDALERLDPAGSRFEYVAQLMPNCPLRTAQDVRDSFREIFASGADVLMSMSGFGWLNPWWSMRRDEQGRLEPVFPEAMSARSQDLPALLSPTGAVWWARAGALRTARTFHVPGCRGWEIPWFHGIDIDTAADWELAERLLEARQLGVDL